MKNLIPPPPPVALAEAPPPPGVPEPNPYDALFDGQPSPSPAANPYDVLFDQPPAAAAPPPPVLKNAPKAPAPISQPAPQPAPILKNPIKPQVPAPPPMQPPAPPPHQSALIQAAEDGAKGALEWLSHTGALGKSVVDTAKKTSEESKHNDGLSQFAAGAAGAVHGPLKFTQDAYNAVAGQLGHGSVQGVRFDAPAAHFADDYKNLPGIRKLNEAMPGHFDVASTGGQAAVPVKVPLPGVGKLPGMLQGAAHGAAAGGAIGYVGNAGEQYKNAKPEDQKHGGNINQGEALKAAGEGMAFGGTLGAVGHGTAGAVKRIFEKTEEKPEGPREVGTHKPEATTEVHGQVIRDTNAGPVEPRLTPRQDRAYAPGAKSKLELADEEALRTGQPIDVKTSPATIQEQQHAGLTRGQAAEATKEPPQDPLMKLAQDEGRLYPLHKEGFDNESWRPKDLTDHQIEDLLSIRNSQTRQSNAYIPKSREIDALTQEKTRRAARIRDGYPQDWPDNKRQIHELTDDELAAQAMDDNLSTYDNEEAAYEILRRHEEKTGQQAAPQSPEAPPAPEPAGQMPGQPETLPQNQPVSEPIAAASSSPPGPLLAEPIAPVETALEANLTEAPPVVPENTTQIESTPQIAETNAEPTAQAWTLEKTAKGYKWTNAQTGEVRQRNVGKAEAERIVAGLNEGTINAKQGLGDKQTFEQGTSDHRQAIIGDGQEVPAEHAPIFHELADSKHALDEAAARKSAAFDELQKQAGEQPVIRSKPKATYNRELEKHLLETYPDKGTYEVQSSRKLTPTGARFKSEVPRDKIGTYNELDVAHKEAKIRYDKAREQAIRTLSEDPNAADSITVPHEKGEVNIRKIPNRQDKTIQAELAARLEKDAPQEMEPDVDRSRKFFANIARALHEAYKPDGLSMSALPGTKQILTAVNKLGPAIKNLDPRTLGAALKNQLNSDIYEMHADPAFVKEYREHLGGLDLAFQGVEKLKTAEQKKAWMSNRYSDPGDIRTGQNGTNLLDKQQRTALIRQNSYLDNMADGAEQYVEHLKSQGIKPGLAGKGRLLRTLQSDLVQLDPRRYGGKDWLTKLSSELTHGIYGMTTLGNWQIHSLHAIEAASVGTAYDAGAFAKSVKQLATDEDVQKYVKSFDSSSGILKRVQETSPGGEGWLKLQKGALDMVAGKGTADKLANSDKAHAIGEVIEGSAAETKKLHLMRAISANRTAGEMNYPGGGKQLMKDMLDPKTMNPTKRLEAATKIVYHMNQMVGYTPHGISDLNVFQRLANTTTPLFKLMTPFTTTRIQQSRVLTKFFSNAVLHAKAGDYQSASKLLAQGMLMPVMIGLVGGRAAVPREIQDALHYAAPKQAKQFLQLVDHANVVGRFLLNKEVEHVTPQLFVPGYLGEGFPAQVAGALNNIAEKPIGSKQHIRGLLTVAAMFGINSIAERMGAGQIMKLGTAFQEGLAGSHKVWAGRLDNSITSTIKSGDTAAKIGKKIGLPVEPGKNSGILGSHDVPTNLLHEVYQKVIHGESYAGAEFINKMRDDDAFGNMLHHQDEKLYERLEKARYKIQKSGGDVEHFWEEQFDHREKQHKPNEQVANRVEA